MLGKRLKELRGRKTQQEIADLLHISRARYSHYENEHVQPDNDMLQRMASFHKVSVDYLLGRTNERNKEKDSVDKLIEYLDLELTDEEIMDRMTFKVDNLILSPEEVKEFIAFVRAKRFMKSGQGASASKPERP